MGLGVGRKEGHEGLGSVLILCFFYVVFGDWVFDSY